MTETTLFPGPSFPGDDIGIVVFFGYFNEMVSGNTLRLLRTLKGIKQASLARKLGISQQAYSKLEKCDKLNAEKLKVILIAMGCTMQDIEVLSQFSNF